MIALDHYHILCPISGGEDFRSRGANNDRHHPRRHRVVGNLLNGEIALTPVITQAADYLISIDADGFDPAVLSVPPGAVIQWINVDMQDHTATSTDPALDYPSAVGNGGWDSGVLGAGDGYHFQMDIMGTLAYHDGENPLNTGVIIVDPDLAGGGSVYLPLVMRNH